MFLAVPHPARQLRSVSKQQPIQHLPMNDRDILRHDRHDSLDRVSTFGSENHADLRADRNAIDGKNLTNTAANLQGLESTESISILLLEASQEVTRLDAMMQNLYRRHPAKLHA